MLALTCPMGPYMHEADSGPRCVYCKRTPAARQSGSRKFIYSAATCPASCAAEVTPGKPWMRPAEPSGCCSLRRGLRLMTMLSSQGTAAASSRIEPHRNRSSGRANIRPTLDLQRAILPPRVCLHFGAISDGKNFTTVMSSYDK